MEFIENKLKKKYLNLILKLGNLVQLLKMYIIKFKTYPTIMAIIQYQKMHLKILIMKQLILINYLLKKS